MREDDPGMLDLSRLMSSRPPYMRSYMVVVFLTTLWIFLGVGCLPILDVKRSNCLEDVSLRTNVNLPSCDGQMADEKLTAEQRHEGLLRELQDLAEHERHYAQEKEDYDQGNTDNENNWQTKVAGGRIIKEEGDSWALDWKGERSKDEARMKAARRGAKQTERELEELLAKEIQKKETSKRHGGEVGEEKLQEEPRVEQYEYAKKMEHQKVKRPEEVEKEEKSEKGEREKKKKKENEKNKEAEKSEEEKREDTEMERRIEARKNEAELMAEKERVERELEALMWEEQDGGMKVLDKERQREEKKEELQELLRKMKIVQEKRRTATEDKIRKGQEEITEQEIEGDKDAQIKKEEGAAMIKEDNIKLKKPQQKRDMEKASDERTQQFERERQTDTEQKWGKEEEEDLLPAEVHYSRKLAFSFCL